MTGKDPKQCDQAIAAAQAATAAGYHGLRRRLWRFDERLLAPRVDTHNPCTTMQAIASDKTRFYSMSSTCQMSGSPNAVAFSARRPSSRSRRHLTKPRLLVQYAHA